MADSEKTRIALARHFVDSGAKERLLNLLRSRLADSGWNDALYAYCRETVRNRKYENVTIDLLVKETSDYGRSNINESIKKEILGQIKKFLDEATD